jgi:phage terminase Nu1 subunit (DNA packaging protein)
MITNYATRPDSGVEHEVIDQRGAATFLDVEPRTLESWRSRGVGPRFVRYSRRCVRYRLSDLKQWLEERVVRTETMTPR